MWIVKLEDHRIKARRLYFWGASMHGGRQCGAQRYTERWRACQAARAYFGRVVRLVAK